MKGQLIVYRDVEELAERFSDLLMDKISRSLSKKKAYDLNYPDRDKRRFDLAISGGSTPQIVFSALASKYPASPLWLNTHFWWVDERMVPPDHPESNFGVANRLLFAKINIPAENIHRIKGENDPLLEAADYASQIISEVPADAGRTNGGVENGNYVGSADQKNLENGGDIGAMDSSKGSSRPIFDLVILGIGDDGHTASIFPNQMELLDSELICAVAHHPVSGQPRVTLTGKQINHASEIAFLVTGENKAERLSEIRQGGEEARLLPAAYIHPVHGKLFWYCDSSALRLLP